MRLILQGRPADKLSLPDIWLLDTNDGTFLTAPYMAKGYNRMDIYAVGGGGGGGQGGSSRFVSVSEIYAGGGGGGGGGGILNGARGIDLFVSASSCPYIVGLGGAGQTSADFGFTGVPGGDTTVTNASNLVANILAKGGDGGSRGADSTTNRDAGGGGGGGSGGKNGTRTFWDPAAPSVAAQGTSYDPSGGGGNGGSAILLPTAGQDGAVNDFGYGIIVRGGGGGGGAAGRTIAIGGGSSDNPDTNGGAGGKGWNSTSLARGPKMYGITYTDHLNQGGGGGAGGSGHNLSVLSRVSDLFGVPSAGDPSIMDSRALFTAIAAIGIPGAGGCGGIGMVHPTQTWPGTVGSPGSTGCVLIRVYLED